MPDVLERMLNEPWWKKPKEETPDLPSKLLYLCEILRLKQADSYPSACSYVSEIFRYENFVFLSSISHFDRIASF